MGLATDPTGRVETGDSPAFAEFLRVKRYGYIRVRDLVRGGLVAYVFLIGIITVFTNDFITLVFLVITALVLLRFTAIERYLSPRWRIRIHIEGGLYVAEHVATGITRHGKTVREALDTLDAELERRRNEPARE